MQFIRILAFLTLLSVAMANKEVCKKISNCKCQHSKGIVDLSKISSKVFTATKGDESFRYFPCSQTVDMTPACTITDNNAVCGLQKSTNHVLDWGLEDSVTFLVPNNADYNVVIAKFTSSDSKRKTEVYLDCPVGKKARAEGLEVLEVQGDNVELRLTSQAACYTPNTPHTTPTKPHTTPTKPHTTPTKPHTTPTKPHTPPTKPHTTPTKPATSTTPTPIFQINLKEWGHWYAIVGSVGLLFVLFFFYFLVRLVLRYGSGGDKGGRPKEACSYLIGLFCDGILCVFSCFPCCRNAIGRRTRGYEAVSVEEGPINNLNNNNYYSVNNNNNSSSSSRSSRAKSCVIL